ncbi:MAG: hypothetical protein GY851_26250 [bacterium]|nr:hypothetical protein [bacterium]
MSDKNVDGASQGPRVEWVFLAVPWVVIAGLGNLALTGGALEALGDSAGGALLVLMLIPCIPFPLAVITVALIILGAIRGGTTRYPELNRTMWWLAVLSAFWTLALVPLLLAGL